MVMWFDGFFRSCLTADKVGSLSIWNPLTFYYCALLMVSFICGTYEYISPVLGTGDMRAYLLFKE